MKFTGGQLSHYLLNLNCFHPSLVEEWFGSSSYPRLFLILGVHTDIDYLLQNENSPKWNLSDSRNLYSQEDLAEGHIGVEPPTSSGDKR